MFVPESEIAATGLCSGTFCTQTKIAATKVTSCDSVRVRAAVACATGQPCSCVTGFIVLKSLRSIQSIPAAVVQRLLLTRSWVQFPTVMVAF